MVLGDNEPHQVYVQVNALDPWVCGPEPTGVACPHEWVTVRLCDKLAWPNKFNEKANSVFISLRNNFTALMCLFFVSLDVGKMGVPRMSCSSVSGIGSSNKSVPASELLKQEKSPVIHGKLSLHYVMHHASHRFYHLCLEVFETDSMTLYLLDFITEPDLTQRKK